MCCASLHETVTGNKLPALRPAASALLLSRFLPSQAGPSQVRVAKLDVNRAQHRRRRSFATDLHRRARRRLHRDRQQLDRAGALAEPPCTIQLAPIEDLVGINPVRPCHTRHRCAHGERLLDDLPLLLYRPALPLQPRWLPGCGRCCADRLTGNVHLRSKWTRSIMPTKRGCSPITASSRRPLPDAYGEPLSFLLSRTRRQASRAEFGAVVGQMRIKLSIVVSDLLGASGLRILRFGRGRDRPQEIGDLGRRAIVPPPHETG